MMPTHKHDADLRPMLAAGLAILALAGTVSAQQQDAEGDTRGVARLSVMGGEVSIRRGDSGDWVAAAVNAPRMAPDRVMTGGNGYAEIQLDWANFVRLPANSEIQLSDLENGHFLIQVAQGSVAYRILRDSNAQPEVVTPMTSVRPLKKGIYRVGVLEDGQTAVTVRSGEAEIATPRGVERLQSGKTMQLRGAPGDPEFQVSRAFDEDEFDRWCRNRDRDLERTESYNYASRDEYGVEDLDGNGRWVNEPEYGTVWAPTVAAGWAPYRNGRWAWLDFYGWSWVSYDPWGWAPYHYGRWFYRSNIGWCWWPGARYARHSWAPAHVAFFGWGSPGFHSGFSFGFGNVGWVPLAPYEAQHRWWGRNYYGGNRGGINVVNVNVTNVYRNARFNGVTAVDAEGFARGRGGAAFRNDAELRQANLVRGQLPVTPGRESLRLSDREARGPAVDRAEGRQYFIRRQPAQVGRVSFEQQRRSVDAITRQTFGGQGGEGFRPQAGAAGPQQQRQDPGWRRFGEPTSDRVRHEGQAARENFQQRETPNGWRTFGATNPGESVRQRQPFEGRVDTGGRTDRSPADAPRVDQPRVEAPPPRVERAPRREWFDRGGGSPEPVRINQPVVRERSAPRMESPRPAPQMERAPRMDSPRGVSNGGGGRPESRGVAGGNGGGGRTASRGGGGGRSESRGGGNGGGGNRGGRGR